MSQSKTAESEGQAEGRYRLLVDSITDYAIYMLDPDGIVTNWNAGAQRFKGYLAGEIVGSHFSRFYTEGDRASGLPERALKIAATEGKFEAEGWRLRKDGERFWAHIVIDPILAPDGSILGYAKITRDLTERRAAEETLRQSEEQFRLLVQSVTDYAIFMLSPEGFVSTWNPGAERIKGYKAEEIIGSHFSRFYTAEDAARGLPETALQIARDTGRFLAEGVRVRQDGTQFRASVVIDAIRNDLGHLVGFAKITRDVTEREEAQRELEQAREALFQSQKMDALGQLTGGVAHDFNNLLMAITSSLELLKKRLSGDDAAQKLIANAMEGAERGATLTQRMLAFARRQELKPVRVDVPRMVMGMSELLERSLGPAWSIETQFPLNLSPVNADLNQLEMTLLNLVVNARDAMVGGGIITIQAREHLLGQGEVAKLSPGKYVTLSVIDTGSGMDADTLQRAVEPFYTTKGVGKGTGLGLSMIHGFAEQNCGTFRLKSELGVGTTAEVWLPAMAPATPAAAPAEPIARMSETARACTILAVDDDALILMNTVVMLEDMGHTVFSAYSGADALGIFRERPEINLVITDQAMPGMTGSQLASAIRDERPGIPIILATGYGELPTDLEHAVLRLGKPFGQKDLQRSLSEVLMSSAS
jgi:PAS domain S-box-containing protein